MSAHSLTPKDPNDLLLRDHTHARVGLGRSGASLTTRAWLGFKAAHAAAKDAVHVSLNVEEVCEAISQLGNDVLACDTLALDRHAYLRAPELGRHLPEASRTRIAEAASKLGTVDLAIIVSDGLSATAVHKSALPVLAALLPLLQSAGLKLAPICVVRLGRVALQDEIGSLFRASMALTLIGERPGLAAADSLGAYVVHEPKPGNTDANRACISNIHSRGLAAEQAAQAILQSLWKLGSGSAFFSTPLRIESHRLDATNYNG